MINIDTLLVSHAQENLTKTVEDKRSHIKSKLEKEQENLFKYKEILSQTSENKFKTLAEKMFQKEFAFKSKKDCPIVFFLYIS